MCVRMVYLKPFCCLRTLTRPLVLFVGITIALLLYSDFSALQFAPSTPFGCEFTPTGYRLRDDPPRSPTDGMFSKPVWGDERKSLILSDESELLELIKHIDKINGEVLDTKPYNSFDNYIEFYKSYKSSGLEFSVFYAGYQPDFRPAENCISLAIESLSRIHTRLAFRWPSLPSHTYLVSSRELKKDWIGAVEWENTEEQDDVHLMAGIMQTKHVVGALKVQVMNGRHGIILVDQGFAIESPIVLMSDGKYPHTNRKIALDYNAMYSYEWIAENRYISWNIYEYGEAEPYEWHRIYVHRPYCSFLYNTEKQDLLHNRRSIVLRNREGKVVGAVYFYIKLNAETDVIFIRRNKDKDDRVYHRVPMRSLSLAALENNIGTHNQKDLEIVDMTNKLLRFTPGVLLGKLQTIYTILQDEEFVRGCLQLEGEEKENE